LGMIAANLWGRGQQNPVDDPVGVVIQKP